MLADNPKELFDYVKNVTIPEIIEYMENISEEELTESLRDTVYNNTSGSYDNTFSLLNAVRPITVKTSSLGEVEASIETFIDENLMDYNYESFYENGNEDNRKFIVGWLNDGHGGYYKGNVINYEGRHFVEKAQEKINKTAKSRLSKFLKGIGYKLSK